MKNKESMIQLLEEAIRVLKEEDSFKGMIYDKSGNPGQIRCLWETISENDRLKPMGLSCPCPRCTPYSLSGGAIGSTNKSLLMNQIS